MVSKNINLLLYLARIFHKSLNFILQGGAESFKDKRRFFFRALQAHHNKNKTTQSRIVNLEINRSNLLDSVSLSSRLTSLIRELKQRLFYWRTPLLPKAQADYSFFLQSYEATKNFSVSKWCRRFHIKFQGEPGTNIIG